MRPGRKGVSIMRALFVSPAVLLAALGFATSAMAHDADRKAAIAAEMANDPAVQEHVADSVSDAVAALLDFRVGALERAANPFSNARRSDTLRDRMERDDPYFEQRSHANARRATRAAGVMADEFAGMLPELRARLARMKHRLHDDAYGAYDAPPPAPEGDVADDWDD
jgi:hypothetical protein